MEKYSLVLSPSVFYCTFKDLLSYLRAHIILDARLVLEQNLTRVNEIKVVQLQLLSQIESGLPAAGAHHRGTFKSCLFESVTACTSFGKRSWNLTYYGAAGLGSIPGSSLFFIPFFTLQSKHIICFKLYDSSVKTKFTNSNTSKMCKMMEQFPVHFPNFFNKFHSCSVKKKKKKSQSWLWVIHCTVRKIFKLNDIIPNLNTK